MHASAALVTDVGSLDVLVCLFVCLCVCVCVRVSVCACGRMHTLACTCVMIARTTVAPPHRTHFLSLLYRPPSPPLYRPPSHRADTDFLSLLATLALHVVPSAGFQRATLPQQSFHMAQSVTCCVRARSRSILALWTCCRCTCSRGSPSPASSRRSEHRSS